MRCSAALTGAGLRLQKVGVHQRQEPVVPGPGLLEVSREQQVDQGGHGGRDLVGHHRDQSVAAGGDDRQGEPVVSRQHGKVLGALAQDIHHLLEVAARLLDAHDVGVPGKPERHAGLKVDRGAAGYVVQADRPGCGVGDGHEMAVETFLGGLVVVGGGAEDVVDADAAHSPGFVHRPCGVVAGGARHHRHPACRDLHHRGHHPLPLRVVQRLGLAGRPARHQEVDPFRDLPVHQRPERGEIDRAGLGEWGHQRGAASLEACHAVSPKSRCSKVKTPVFPGSHSAAAKAPAANASRSRATWLSETVSCGPS